MFDVVVFNGYEAFLFAIAAGVLFLYFYKGDYTSREALICTLAMVPVLYFSINMVTEAVTADEPSYEPLITHVRELKQSKVAKNVLYEYKFAQMTLGTFFLLFHKAGASLGETDTWMLYKCLHWMLMFFLSLLTANIWRRYILVGKDRTRAHIAESLVLLSLIGLPLTCLLMKVTNYDAGSTYPAVLGTSMLWAAFNTENRRMGFWATVVTALGVLDKWTALPYWMISVVLYAVLVIGHKDGFKEKIISVFLCVAKAYLAALALSGLYYGYAYVQQGGFFREIDLGVVVFSFIHAVKYLLFRDYTIASSSHDAIYVVFAYIGMAVGALLVHGVCSCCANRGNKAASILLGFNGVLIIFGVLGGIIGSYFIPLRIAPFMEIESGHYPSGDSFTGWTYHYGAKTAMGHFIAKACYECATIVANYPTAITAMLLVCAMMLVRKHHGREMMFCSLVLSAASALLIAYAVAGLPADAKYYSYPMMALVLAGIYLGYIYISKSAIAKWALASGYFLYLLEMCFFIPNVKSFSPMWLWHSAEFNQSVRTGQWYAGEVMFWGEQVAIAGNIIKEIEGTENCAEVTIFSNYAATWPGNPGYTLLPLNRKHESELRFDENTYYIINKFTIFRGKTPAYIYEVEPITSIAYKGEIGAWIYRGDQLEGRAKELLEVK